MTDAEKQIREALAAGPTPGRWIYLFVDRLIYTRLEDGCRGTPVVGVDHRFWGGDEGNLRYIAACNPAAIRELLAEMDRLRGLLCKYDMRTRLVGDGCEFCNPQLADELAKEQR